MAQEATPQLAPLHHARFGRPLPPLAGAQEGGDGGDAGQSTEGQQPSGTQDGDQPTDGPEGQAEGDQPPENPALHKANREAAALRQRLKTAETALKEREDAEKTELEKASTRAEDAERELTELRAEALQRTACEAAGLPAEFAGRLRGSTEEELAEDATALAEQLSGAGAQRAPSAPRVPAGPQGRQDTPTDYVRGLFAKRG